MPWYKQWAYLYFGGKFASTSSKSHCHFLSLIAVTESGIFQRKASHYQENELNTPSRWWNNTIDRSYHRNEIRFINYKNSTEQSEPSFGILWSNNTNQFSSLEKCKLINYATRIRIQLERSLYIKYIVGEKGAFLFGSRRNLIAKTILARSSDFATRYTQEAQKYNCLSHYTSRWKQKALLWTCHWRREIINCKTLFMLVK